MCFSPQASFGAAAILSVLGTAALYRSRGSRFALIAAVPCFFAVQQALEGFVWLALGRGDINSLSYFIPVYGFLFFAMLWWPLYIPITLWYIEHDPTRKKFMLGSIIAGTCVAILAVTNLVVSPVEVVVVGHHLSYQQTSTIPFSDTFYIIGLLCYLIATSGALFLSTIRRAWIMGILVIVACVTAQIWYYIAFGSVWCFFAALSSSLILLAL
jgi:hypothetical protein